MDGQELDQFTTELSVPLDSDGFLRRECPTCERELKWLMSEGDSSEPAPGGGYHCPYCRVQAPPDSWHTKAQLELATSTIMEEAVAPELRKLKRDIEAMNRSGSLISFNVDVDVPSPVDPLSEIDDMRRVNFTCHPGEPVKVLDDWDRQVHCIICGAAATNQAPAASF